MLVQHAYKTELDLSDQQVTACRQHAGAARGAAGGTNAVSVHLV